MIYRDLKEGDILKVVSSQPCSTGGTGWAILKTKAGPKAVKGGNMTLHDVLEHIRSYHREKAKEHMAIAIYLSKKEMLPEESIVPGDTISGTRR